MVFYHNMKDASEQLKPPTRSSWPRSGSRFLRSRKTEERTAFQNARGNIRGITEQADAMAEALEQLKKRIGECRSSS